MKTARIAYCVEREFLTQSEKHSFGGDVGKTTRFATAKLLRYDQHINFMGFDKKSKAQLEKHIRQVARDSERVLFTEHSVDMMVYRKVLRSEVHECLKRGAIDLEPEPDGPGSIKCRIERYLAGRNIAVVVALDDNDPDLIVVTVISKKRR